MLNHRSRVSVCLLTAPVCKCEHCVGLLIAATLTVFHTVQWLTSLQIWTAVGASIPSGSTSSSTSAASSNIGPANPHPPASPYWDFLLKRQASDPSLRRVCHKMGVHVSTSGTWTWNVQADWRSPRLFFYSFFSLCWHPHRRAHTGDSVVAPSKILAECVSLECAAARRRSYTHIEKIGAYCCHRVSMRD